MRSEVSLDEGKNGFDYLLLASHLMEKASCGFDALDVMPMGSNAAILPAGGGGFTEVVAQHRQTDDEILVRIPGSRAGESVHAVQGMRPDVTFRVPFRVLRTSVERG